MIEEAGKVGPDCEESVFYAKELELDSGRWKPVGRSDMTGLLCWKDNWWQCGQ